MHNKTTYILLIILLWSGMLLAQNFHITHYSQQNGLTTNEIFDVHQDRFGFFWIATDEGIVRFDGNEFEDYSQLLPSNYCRSFCAIPEGILVSHDAGISVIKPGLDSTIILPYLSANINPDDDKLYYPDQLYFRKNGELWIGQAGGRISKLANKTVQEIRTFSELNKHPQISVYFSELDNSSLIIGFSDGRLCKFNDSNQRLQQIHKLPKINDLKLFGNELWVAGQELTKLELSNDGQQVLNSESFYSKQGEANTLSSDNEGNIYVGIKDKGLYYLDRKEGRTPQFIKVFSNNNPHSLGNLPFKNIQAIRMESNNRMWICSSEGLGILQRRFFESVGTLPNANTTSICLAEDGNIFVSFGDIYSISRSDIAHEGALLEQFSGGNVSALATAKNQLWAGTSKGTLFRLNKKGQTLQTIDLRERGEGIFFLKYDSRNKLWICQAPEFKPLTGIGCLESDGKLKEYGEDKGLHSLILCLHESKKNKIYCGGSGKDTYLYRYLGDEDIFINLSLPLDFDPGIAFAVHDLTVDKNGVIWLATTHGLLQHNMDRVERIDIGLSDIKSEIRAVCSMDDGSIWASTETEGIIRVGDSATSILFGEESGLPSEVMNYRCLIKAPGGRIWAGSSEGIVFSLEENPKPRSSKKPMLQKVSLDGKVITADAIKMNIDQQLLLSVLSPSYHGFKTFYQYKIDENDWIDMGTYPNVHFQNQQVGTYTLSIRSKKEGGYLWSSPLITTIAVEDYWYKHPFFAAVGVLVFLSLFFVVIVFIKQKYKRDIDILAKGNYLEKKEIEKRETKLAKVEHNLLSRHHLVRTQMLSLEIIRRLISKIEVGMKWDLILEIISIDILKFPGVVAFEIGIRSGDQINFEGYSEKSKKFTSDRVDYQLHNNLASYTISLSKPMIYNNLSEDIKYLNLKNVQRHGNYKSAIYVPFYHRKEEAILILYSNKQGYFTQFGLKAVDVFTTYLEQII
jgi:ligand-binding sensor domain-containing protein